MITLKNATYVDWETSKFIKTDIFLDRSFENGISFSVPENLNSKVSKIIDCENKIVTKSFGCAHTHGYSSLMHGLPSSLYSPQNYYDSLKHFWWNLDTKLDKELIEINALITAIEFAKRGTTFIIDHHSSPNCIEGSLDIIAKAFDQIGVSHLLCHEISDRNGVNIATKQLEETEKYLENNQGLVGLHASFTLTNKTLKKSVELAEKFNTGIHVHAAEDLYDQEHCYDIHNKRVIERFNDYGILNLPATILVNCLYLTDNERRLIQEKNSYIAQNTESCLKNNESHFNSCLINENVMLGTDGVHFNMLRALKNSYYLGQHSETVNVAEASSRLRKVNKYISQNNFAGHSENNLIILDYIPNSAFNEENFAEHLVTCMDSTHIEHVISNGKLIVENRKVITIDELELKTVAQKRSEVLWNKMYSSLK